MSATRACPICGKPARLDRAENPTAPFCSKRCRLIDLGTWLDEGYVLGSPITDRNIPAREMNLPLYDDDEDEPRRGSSSGDEGSAA